MVPVTEKRTETNLLHDIQLAVLRLKQLDEQLEDLWVQQLVAGADLCRGRAEAQTPSLTNGSGSARRRRTSSSKAKWIGVWSVCSWKYRGSDTVQSTHFKTPIATTGNLKRGAEDASNPQTWSLFLVPLMRLDCWSLCFLVGLNSPDALIQSPKFSHQLRGPFVLVAAQVVNRLYGL